MVDLGAYGVKIETTLPLADAPADSSDTATTVTTFEGIVELVASTPIDSISGTSGVDTIDTGDTGVMVNGYGGADSITLGTSKDYVVLNSTDGSATKAGAATVTDFTNDTDVFLLNGFNKSTN